MVAAKVTRWGAEAIEGGEFFGTVLARKKIIKGCGMCSLSHLAEFFKLLPKLESSPRLLRDLVGLAAMLGMATVSS